MIFKCVAKYEVVKEVKDYSDRFQLRDLGKIEHTFYDLKSFDALLRVLIIEVIAFIEIKKDAQKEHLVIK